LAALVIGIGTAAKLTNAYLVIFSFVILITFYYRDVALYIRKIGLFKAVLIVAAGLGCGAIVFLIRNYHLTGNPFYPVAKFGFKNIYISDYAFRPALYEYPTNWHNAVDKMKLHLFDSPPLLLVIFLGFFTRAKWLSLFYIAMVVFLSKQTGPMFNFRMTTSFLVISLLIFIISVQHFWQMKNFQYKKHCSIAFIIFVIAFSKIQFEKLVKIPFKNYTVKTEILVRSNVDYWDILLNNNLENRSNANYVFMPKEEIFPYFSRFPAVSMYDSVEKYRYRYFK
jgi:hypothetical protein